MQRHKVIETFATILLLQQFSYDFVTHAKGVRTFDEVRQKIIPNQGVVAVVGYAAEIPCEVTPLEKGDSPVLILWYRNIFGTPIYSYDMRDEASNGHGYTTGRHWMDRKILGTRATFHLEETGTFNNKEVPILRAYLRIKNLRTSDAGPYRCRVDFKRAPTRNVKVKLNLLRLPSRPDIQIEQGKPLARNNDDPAMVKSPPLKIGTDLNIVCFISEGKPIPKLNWWLEDADGGKRQNLTATTEVKSGGYPKIMLNFGKVKRSDLGKRIGCSAVNTDLVPHLESFMVLDMLLPPIRAKIVREWDYFLAGQVYNVSCQVQGSNPAAYVKAYIDKREIEVADFKIHKKGGISTTRLRYVPSMDDNSKFLSCRAENPHLNEQNAVEDQWRIEVQYVPLAELGLPDYKATKVEANEGERVQLKCSVNANPQPHSIHWRKNGKTLDASQFKVESTLVRYINKDGKNLWTTTISLDSIRPHMTGNYTCIAENMLGLGQSNNLELKIKFRPRCSRTGENLWFVGLEEKVRLPCHVKAFPKSNLTFSWTFQEDVSAALNKGQPRPLFRRNSSVEDILFNAKDPGKSVLIFQPSTVKDFGQLSCWASNEAGKQTTPCLYRLKPRGLPHIDLCEVKSLGLNWVRIFCHMSGRERDQNELNTKETAQEWKNYTELRLSVQQKVENISGSKMWKVMKNFSQPLTEGSEILIEELSSGTLYNIGVKAFNKFRVPNLSPKSFDVEIATLQEQEEEEEPIVMVVLKDSNDTNESGIIAINDPIRLLPIVGVLCIIVIILILIAVIIIVVMRSRGYSSGDPDFKTHIAFNRSLDFDIDEHDTLSKKSKQNALDVIEKVSDLDTFDQLNNVKFEGFSTLQRRPSQNGNAVPSVTEVSVHEENVEVPVAKLIDTERSKKEDSQESTKDLCKEHFPFREAIAAPTPVHSLNEVQTNKEDNSDNSVENPTKPRVVTFQINREEDIQDEEYKKNVEYLL